MPEGYGWRASGCPREGASHGRTRLAPAGCSVRCGWESGMPHVHTCSWTRSQERLESPRCPLHLLSSEKQGGHVASQGEGGGRLP